MKLPDFLEFNIFNNLRYKMEAALIDWSPNSSWNRFNPDEWRRLNTVGLDVPLEDVESAEDNTLEYKGEKVVLYIRDQQTNIKYKGSSGTGYRFHIADCQTLKNMRQAGRFERYVVTKRKDGKFLVNKINFGDFVTVEEECELPVCKNCLKTINYKHYNGKARGGKDKIWENFNLTEYFDRYSPKFSNIPKHTAKTAPLSVYSKDWDEVSNSYRKSANWKCEKCKINLMEFGRFLHVHHKDGNKANNSTSNLKALCIKCHSEEPAHDHMKNSRDYKIFLSNFRQFNKIGISPTKKKESTPLVKSKIARQVLTEKINNTENNKFGKGEEVETTTRHYSAQANNEKRKKKNKYPETIHEAISLKPDLIRTAIIQTLMTRPHHSCVKKSLPKFILQKFEVIGRGRPRKLFVRKVNRSITELERAGVVEVYKSKNVRIRLIKSMPYQNDLELNGIPEKKRQIINSELRRKTISANSKQNSAIIQNPHTISDEWEPGDETLRGFIHEKIRSLGTIKAVNNFYSKDSRVDKYARKRAPDILNTFE